jgi:predicted Ser/Thr protein kinase
VSAIPMILEWLACLAGLVAFVLLVGVVKHFDSREKRPRPDDRSGPAPPRQVVVGPTVVPQFFAGCALFLLIPLGLLAIGLGLPAWQKAGAMRGHSLTEYLILGCVAALYLLVLVKLLRVFRGPRPVPAAAPAPAAKPAAAPDRSLAVVIAAPVVVAMVIGLAVTTFAGTDGRVRVERVDFWGTGIIVALYMLLVSRHFRQAAPPPVAERADPPEAPELPRECPKCRQPIAPGAPAGLCPRCLLGGAMAADLRHSPTVAYGPFEPPPVEEVARLVPHLEVVRLIGVGGMGAVYLARQPALDRLVALKLIRPHEGDPTFAERFVREAKAMARLSHPNVVSVYESGEAEGLPYLVMEYVDGVTLRDAMREKKLAPAEALAIVPQICEALEYAHAQGVVHRDVKPENILLTKDGRVKIADFGLAKVTDPAGVSLTGTRQAMGTPHYMAPEQWEKPAEVDHRADIYALGVVLYELLTGELPLGRFDPPSQKIQLDIRIDEVVLRALAKEPGRRYQHVSEVRTDLEHIRSRPAAGRCGWTRRGEFREYRSKATFLGWPLVHVVSGRDPVTGMPRVAKGWVAIGDGAAVGGVAVAGGFAAGVLAIAGGLSFGLLSLAGLAIGVLAAGGAAGGVLFAAGGAAMSGGLAIGGAALGRFAIGGGAAGFHVLSGSRQDDDFGDELAGWVERLGNMLWPF